MAIFLLTTTNQTIAQATGGGGFRGSHSRGRKGPHHHQQAKAAFTGKSIQRDVENAVENTTRRTNCVAYAVGTWPRQKRVK